MNTFPTKLSVSLVFTLYLGARYVTQGSYNCAPFKLFVAKRDKKETTKFTFLLLSSNVESWLLPINEVDF